MAKCIREEGLIEKGEGLGLNRTFFISERNNAIVRRLTSKAVVIGFLQRQRLFAVIASSISSINTEVMFLRTFLIFFSAAIKQ